MLLTGRTSCTSAPPTHIRPQPPCLYNITRAVVHSCVIFNRCRRHSCCRCPCRLDGFMGPNCALEGAQTCVNQCNGRGKCNQGFCKCDTGWYGHDCSQAAAGVVDVPVQPAANVEPVLVSPLPARQHGPARPERRRPLVYVYDMDPEYNSRWGDEMCRSREASGAPSHAHAYSIPAALLAKGVSNECAEHSACCRAKLT